MSRSLIDSLSSLGEGFVFGDANRILSVNEATCTITGYSNEELLALGSLVAIVAPEEREANAERLRRRIGGESVPDHYRTTIVRKDGSRMPIEVAIRAFGSGGDFRLVALIKPVEDAGHDNVADSRSREATLSMFENNPLPMWIYDLDTLGFLEVNDAAVAAYGYTREEFLAMDITQIRPAEDIPLLLESLEGNRPAVQRRRQWRHRLANGKVIDVAVSSHVMPFKDRRAALVVVEDISGRMHLEEMKTSILTALSHELRTPLTALLGFARTLEQRGDEIGSDERLEFAQAIVSQADKLERLLNDLLDVDRVARGALTAKRRRTDVAALIRRIALEIRIEDSHPVRYDLESFTANIDDAMTERIVENLLTNARRHTEHGTPIRVVAARDEGGTHLIVEDEGPGVPPELRDSIFETFRQGPNVSRFSPGLGVGLSIVARFAALHAGAAWVEEREGGGAAFHVLLPDGSG